MFLDKEELQTVSTAEVIAIVTNYDDEIINQIINESIACMEAYLGQYYDVESIFNATGNNRSLLVLKHLKAIVIREIYKRRGKMLEITEKDYEEALNWLEKAGTGKIPTNLPPKPIDEDGDGLPDGDTPYLNKGSKKKYNTGW